MSGLFIKKAAHHYLAGRLSYEDLSDEIDTATLIAEAPETGQERRNEAIEQLQFIAIALLGYADRVRTSIDPEVPGA